ncbi:unnamed protein product [Chrysoparadoxa australica]
MKILQKLMNRKIKKVLGRTSKYGAGDTAQFSQFGDMGDNLTWEAQSPVQSPTNRPLLDKNTRRSDNRRIVPNEGYDADGEGLMPEPSPANAKSNDT